MVKTVTVCLTLILIVAFAAPVFAQDDYPKVEVALGYGNIGVGKLAAGRHSGFAMDADYNFSKALGAEVYTGYYGLGSTLGTNSSLYTNTFGLRAALRKNAHIVPFVDAGFGFSSLQSNSGSARAMATRIGGGLDIPIHDSIAIRLGATKMAFHFHPDATHAWSSGMNYTVGIAFNLTQ